MTPKKRFKALTLEGNYIYRWATHISDIRRQYPRYDWIAIR
jgi:hypothetical protein